MQEERRPLWVTDSVGNLVGLLFVFLQFSLALSEAIIGVLAAGDGWVPKTLRLGTFLTDQRSCFFKSMGGTNSCCTSFPFPHYPLSLPLLLSSLCLLFSGLFSSPYCLLLEASIVTPTSQQSKETKTHNFQLKRKEKCWGNYRKLWVLERDPVRCAWTTGLTTKLSVGGSGLAETNKNQSYSPQD